MTKNEILNVFANETFIVSTISGRFDEDGEYLGVGKEYIEETDINNVVKSIFHNGLSSEEIDIEESILNSIADIIKAFNEINNNLPEYKSTLHIKADYLEKKAESERQNLESAAANFARKHNTGGVNVLFIQKIYEEIENKKQDQSDWNSGERRAERYATCAASGCRDSFWDDNDYVNGKYDAAQDKLYDVLNYIQEHLPLLWAKYESTKSAK